MASRLSHSVRKVQALRRMRRGTVGLVPRAMQRLLSAPGPTREARTKTDGCLRTLQQEVQAGTGGRTLLLEYLPTGGLPGSSAILMRSAPRRRRQCGRDQTADRLGTIDRAAHRTPLRTAQASIWASCEACMRTPTIKPLPGGGGISEVLIAFAMAQVNTMARDRARLSPARENLLRLPLGRFKERTDCPG